MIQQKNNRTDKHWSKLPEKGSFIALKLTLLLVRVLGRRLAYCLVYPVMVYFYFFSKKARLASHSYCLNLTHYAKQKNQVVKVKPFQQFIAFGQSLVDKIAVWNKQITRDDLDFPNRQQLLELIDNKQGAVIFTAHLGNIEIMRAISLSLPHFKINALIFNQHAQQFNQLLTKINPDSQLNLISVDHFDLSLAMRLQQKIDQGELIIIACDRTSVQHPPRTIEANFLGKPSLFPQGGFLMAHLLKVPVYSMLCIKSGKKYRVIFNLFATKLQLSRHNRDKELTQYVQQYSHFIEDYCLQYPTQWFNFFEFWNNDDQE